MAQKSPWWKAQPLVKRNSSKKERGEAKNHLSVFCRKNGEAEQ